MTRALALFALVALSSGAGAADAQPATTPTQTNKPATSSLLGGHNSNQPINVSADAFLGDINSRVGTYTGNVIVTQGDFKLRADRVQVNVEDSKPSRITASGNIVLTSKSGIATGQTGVYDVNPRIVTLTGDVVLTKDKNVMRGSSLQVNLATGQARLEAKGTHGGRVQGLFTPKPQSGGNNQQGH